MADLSLMEFTKRFSDENVCKDYLMGLRWPDEIYCPFCCATNPYVTNRGFRCRAKGCMKKFTICKSTLFENTKIPLSTWFFLIYVTAMNKKHTSSHQMAKNMGLTQKTTWYLMNGIRRLCAERNINKLSGIVEVDECFMGGGGRWSRWGALSTRKQPILGMVERGGRVIIKAIESRNVEDIEQTIMQHIEVGSIVYTDGWMGYKNISRNYDHEWLDHSSREYVRGDVHTNTIECVWRILKTGIRNGSHYISAKHVQRYCDEVAYRYNYRSITAMQRFNDLLTRSVGLESEIEKGVVIKMSEVA